jgi:ubiquinone/menaquinone biosynthesis C-methylase UbiE
VFLEFFRKLKKGTEQDNYGRDILVSMAKLPSASNGKIRILDIGLGQGTDLENITKSLGRDNLELFGVESWEPNIQAAKKKGIKAYPLDIEKDQLPFDDGYFDIVVANQIIEHTKEIFWIFSEISRVLKKGGTLIVGVPNLAAFHNRMMLFLGMQPSSIRLLGPHIRGITKNEFIDFISTDGYFEVEEVKGSNFYPFPQSISKILSRFFPSLAVGLFFKCKRTNKDSTFISVLKTRRFETNYFEGKT